MQNPILKEWFIEHVRCFSGQKLWILHPETETRLFKASASKAPKRLAARDLMEVFVRPKKIEK